MPLTIRTPGAVYKSATPAIHLPIAEANEAAQVQRGDQMQALAESLVPGGTAYGTRHDHGGLSMFGIDVTDVENVSVPTGMRWDTKAKRGKKVLVPALKTDEGKAIAAQMRDLAFAPQSLGAVSKILIITDGTNSYFAAGVIEIIGTDVYATYHLPLSEDGKRSDKSLVDGDPGWTEIPLSEFYAAREAQQTQVAA